MILYRIARNPDPVLVDYDHPNILEKNALGWWMTPDPINVYIEHTLLSHYTRRKLKGKLRFQKINKLPSSLNKKIKKHSVYAFEIDDSYVKKIGGVKRTDGAAEVFIPYNLYFVKFIGKSENLTKQIHHRSSAYFERTSLTSFEKNRKRHICLNKELEKEDKKPNIDLSDKKIKEILHLDNKKKKNNKRIEELNKKIAIRTKNDIKLSLVNYTTESKGTIYKDPQYIRIFKKSKDNHDF